MAGRYDNQFQLKCHYSNEAVTTPSFPFSIKPRPDLYHLCSLIKTLFPLQNKTKKKVILTQPTDIHVS